ncbi:MAG TPA: DUF4430 domain-containing protein, partial [Patescibacteria group bacterium]|nr:DUF4430 domain-containing protein [Patescibacteria group bacterium]
SSRSEDSTRMFEDVNADTALEALLVVGEKENISIETKKFDFGTLVISIDGVENTEKTAWIYYINDESATVGADAYTLSDGDIVSWRYKAVE